MRPTGEIPMASTEEETDDYGKQRVIIMEGDNFHGSARHKHG